MRGASEEREVRWFFRTLPWKEPPERLLEGLGGDAGVQLGNRGAEGGPARDRSPERRIRPVLAGVAILLAVIGISVLSGPFSSPGVLADTVKAMAQSGAADALGRSHGITSDVRGVSGMGDAMAWSLAICAVLVSIAGSVALAYLYVTVRCRGTLFLLIWRSPPLALGAYLYLRSDWRWPKSLLIWGPFGLLTYACGLGVPWAMGRLWDYIHSQGIAVLGLTLGDLIALAGYVGGFVTGGLLLLAIVFLTQDLLRLGRRATGPCEELSGAS